MHILLTTQQYEACILCLAPLLKADRLPNGASLQCNSGCKEGREGGSHLKHSPYRALCTVTRKTCCVLLNMVRMLMSSRPLFWVKSPFCMVIVWNMVLFIWNVRILFLLLLFLLHYHPFLCIPLHGVPKKKKKNVWVEYVHIIPPIRTIDGYKQMLISVHPTISPLAKLNIFFTIYPRWIMLRCLPFQF